MEEKAPSSGLAANEPEISVDNLKSGSGLVAVSSAETEALLEFEKEGFTREHEEDGVVLLKPPPPRGMQFGILDFGPSGVHHLTALTAPPPSNPWVDYPTGAQTGEYVQLSPKTAKSPLIEEDHEPRNTVREAVRAYVTIEPSIVNHGSTGGLRIRVNQFHFSSHRMVDKPDERGYFIHTATVCVTPKWSNPEVAKNIRPAAQSETAAITTGRGRNIGLALSATPSAEVRESRAHESQTTVAHWGLKHVPATELSAVKWKWQMRHWRDFQPFNAQKPHVFRTGSVPELPYEVEDGVAGLTYTVDPTGRHMEAEWGVPTGLITGNIGKLKVLIEIKLQVELVKSKSSLAIIGKKLVCVSKRSKPEFKTVEMSGYFAF